MRLAGVLSAALSATLLLLPAQGRSEPAKREKPPPGMAVLSGSVKLTSASLLGEAEVKSTDALVFLEGSVKAAGSRESRRRKASELPRMVQRDKTFAPGLLVVRVGDTVLFPNEDTLFHNVFSLTEGNQFDLGVYAQGKSKAVRFQKPGVVDVFCNIHPQMIGAIVVTENPYFTQIEKDGSFRLLVPAGKHTVTAYWTRGVREAREVEVKEGETLTLDFALRDTGQKVRHLDKNGQAYGRYK